MSTWARRVAAHPRGSAYPYSHTVMLVSLDARCASRLRILSATFTSSFTSKTKQLKAEISEELSPRVRASLTCVGDAGPEVGPAHQDKR